MNGLGQTAPAGMPHMVSTQAIVPTHVVRPNKKRNSMWLLFTYLQSKDRVVSVSQRYITFLYQALLEIFVLTLYSSNLLQFSRSQTAAT